MTDLQYDLLCRIRDSRLNENDLDSDSEYPILRSCEKEGWVYVASSGGLNLKSIGKHAMLEHEYALEQVRKERSDQEAKERAAHAQNVKDKKKDRCHDFLVAAFGAAVALLFEHIGDVVDAITVMLERILLLLG